LAVDEAAMGLDLDFQDGAVVAAGKGSEGLAAVLTAALVRGQVADLLGGRQGGVITTAVAWDAALLATASAGCWHPALRRQRGRVHDWGAVGEFRQQVSRGVVGAQTVGAVVGLGASAEEPVPEVAVFGLEEGELLLEMFFALSGALVHGLVEVSLLSEGDGFELVGAGLVRRVTGRKGGWGRRGIAGEE
jgi:hypothetical protein